MTIHYFNPGYELSAKRRQAHYTPTKPVRQLRHDLATLPIYYAAAGEGVLVPADFPPELRTEQMVSRAEAGDRIVPWGAAPEVPGIGYETEVMRQLASRERSLELWRKLYEPSLFGPMMPPRRISEESEVPKEGRWVAKLDFSSSGRGVFFPRSIPELREVLRRHQELYLEPWLDRVADRGYEFVRHPDGGIEYVGVHLFTTGQGRYGASLVAPREVVREQLRRQPTTPTHEEYVAHLLERLRGYDFHGYAGPFGIDTVVWRDGDHLRLAPSVEINLRRTMGHVALELSHRYAEPSGQTYLYEITSPQGLTGLPLYLTGSPLSDAPTLLTPLLPSTRFAALLRHAPKW